MRSDDQANISTYPGAPMLDKVMPVRLDSSASTTSSLTPSDTAATMGSENRSDDGEIKANDENPTAGLTDDDSTVGPFPGINDVTVMYPSTFKVSIPLMDLLNPSQAYRSMHRALIGAHLRTHDVLLIPTASGSLHLAVNYSNAGLPAGDLPLEGQAKPFASVPLDDRDLPFLRRFTLLVPTHGGCKGDRALRNQQLATFLYSPVATDPITDGTGHDFDPVAVEQRWFAGQVREQAGKRGVWINAVRICVRKLGSGLAEALYADGAAGQDARRNICGDIVFQEWCNGWGQGCGPDVVLYDGVEQVVFEMEKCFGTKMIGRLAVCEPKQMDPWALFTPEIMIQIEKEALLQASAKVDTTDDETKVDGDTTDDETKVDGDTTDDDTKVDGDDYSDCILADCNIYDCEADGSDMSKREDDDDVIMADQDSQTLPVVEDVDTEVAAKVQA